MLNQFYKYLSKRIVEYFEEKGITKGDKFKITLDSQKKVSELYECLSTTEISESFVYEEYQTIALNYGKNKLIIAGTVEGVTIDYLTTLRNLISEGEGQFENAGILFIHDSTLDSILKGSESLSKKGMPLNIDVIKEDIKKLTKEFYIWDQEIIKFAVDKISEDYHSDNSSIFEYEKILKIIDKKKIEKNDIYEFNLFYDDQLHAKFDRKKIAKRIKENNEFFTEVSLAHQYGNVETDLVDIFADEELEKLQHDNWKDSLTFEDLFRSKQKKADDLVLTYKETKKKVSDEGLEYWEIEDGETKAKKEKRNIIVFNTAILENINISFKFEENLSKEYLDSRKIAGLEANVGGKTLKFSIDVKNLKNNYGEYRFGNKKQKYTFKILVLNIEKNLLLDIEGNWIINKRKLTVIHKKDIIFNKSEEKELQKKVIKENNAKINFFSEEDQIKVELDEELDGDIELELNWNEFVFKLILQDETLKTSTILGNRLWKLKNEKEENFELKEFPFSEENNKIYLKGKEFYTNKELKKLLIFESEIVMTGKMFFKKEGESTLISEEIEVSEGLKEAYYNIIDYFKRNKTLPTLAYMSEELKELYEIYLREVFKELEEDRLLHKKNQKSIMYLGMIKAINDTKEIMLNSLHPINIAYQLNITKEIKENYMDENIAKKFRSNALLPYIYYDANTLYKVSDYDVSLEWKLYSGQTTNTFNSNKAYVNKLVKSKIEEFISHFSYLFELNIKAPLKINIFNMGNCREVMEGIFDYYLSQVNDKKYKKTPENVIPIEVYIYSYKSEVTSFEEISFLSSVNEIKARFPGISLKSKEYSEEDILNMYRENVQFYKRMRSKDEERDTEIEYSHISFYEMDRSIEENTFEDTYKLDTGISLNGISSSLLPKYIGSVYKTGFGLKGYEGKESDLIQLAKKYNALATVVEKQDPFNKDNVIVTAISEEKTEKLDRIYDNSYWITFVDPKVDINYFKENNNSDLLIIHYSDNYTTSSGYDAITVTRKSNIYEEIIGEALRNNEKLKGRDLNYSKVSRQLIDYFNAVNGDWLLTLSKKENQGTREKISILSAINFALAYLDNEMIWVPISSEELLRVSGGAGLSQTDGILSAKNLGIKGKCSDDLLLVGISRDKEDPKISIYPVEVKIGKNARAVKEKAEIQVKTTFETFNKIFEGEDFISKYHRNFLIQVIYTNLFKLKIYGIGKKDNWDILLDPEYKNKLYNDAYTYSNIYKEIIGDYGIISFKKDSITRTIKKKDEILIFEGTEEDGYEFLVSDIEEIRSYISRDIPEWKVIDKVIQVDAEEIETIESNREEKKVEEEKEEFKKIEIEDKAEKNKEFVSTTGMKVIFGKDKNYHREFEWYPNDTNKLMHPNTGIIGTMGTGKTQFTKSLIAQLYQDRKSNFGKENIDILIFDYKGDYIKENFVKATNAKVYNPYKLPFNPLSIMNSPNSKPLLPLHTANTIKETIVKTFKLGQVQESILKDVLMDAYSSKGISKGNRSTWDNPSPTFADVYREFEANEMIKRDSLYAALNTIEEYELFESDAQKTKPLYDLIDGVTVVHLSGYDENIQNLIVAMTLDLFYSQMQITGHSRINGNLREITKLILVDEADNFLSQNFSSIRKILKEGREFGVGTILSTQFLNHFSTGENEYSDYIESWIVHKVPNTTGKEVRKIFGTSNKTEEDELISQISELEKHYSLVKTGNQEVKHIKDLAFWELVEEKNKKWY